MALEIEIKLKVDDLAAVRARLGEVGAKRVGEVMETNLFLDTPERVLLGSDCGLRIRRARDAEGDRPEKLVVTYKGPRGEGPVKSREEIEIGVTDLDAAAELLGRLGYVPVLTFEKRRETWSLDKCTVELDTLPQLGSFVEIECPTSEDVLKVQQKLGLEALEAVPKTYADLVAHHFSDRGERGTSLTF